MIMAALLIGLAPLTSEVSAAPADEGRTIVVYDAYSLQRIPSYYTKIYNHAYADSTVDFIYSFIEVSPAIFNYYGIVSYCDRNCYYSDLEYKILMQDNADILIWVAPLYYSYPVAHQFENAVFYENVVCGPAGCTSPSIIQKVNDVEYSPELVVSLAPCKPGNAVEIKDIYGQTVYKAPEYRCRYSCYEDPFFYAGNLSRMLGYGDAWYGTGLNYSTSMCPTAVIAYSK